MLSRADRIGSTFHNITQMQSADRAFVAETTAKMLLEVKAVLFWEDKPFIFTSGWASPVLLHFFSV